MQIIKNCDIVSFHYHKSKMLILFISISVLLVAIIFIQSKYLILIDNPHGNPTSQYIIKNTPLSGGIFFFIILSISIFFL